MIRWLVIVLFCVLAGGVGCSRPYVPPTPDLPGEGKVYLEDGQPAACCSLLLIPVGPKMGLTCRANTNLDGSFSLKTVEQTGVVAGKYRVAIRPFITPSTPPEIADRIESGIPEIYQDDEASPLVLEIRKPEDLIIRLK